MMKASASSTNPELSHYSHMLHPAGFPNSLIKTSRDWRNTGVEDVNIRLSTLCLRYITKVQSDDDHPLHSYTTTGRTSEHSGRHIKSKSRTSMRSKSLFQRFSQCHFYFYFHDTCVIIIHNYVQHHCIINLSTQFFLLLT